jgi:hypothetical protein
VNWIIAEIRCAAVVNFPKYSKKCGIVLLLFQDADVPHQHQELIVDIMPGNTVEEVQFHSGKGKGFFDPFPFGNIPDITLDDRVVVP